MAIFLGGQKGMIDNNYVAVNVCELAYQKLVHNACLDQCVLCRQIFLKKKLNSGVYTNYNYCQGIRKKWVMYCLMNEVKFLNSTKGKNIARCVFK